LDRLQATVCALRESHYLVLTQISRWLIGSFPDTQCVRPYTLFVRYTAHSDTLYRNTLKLISVTLI